MPKELIISGNEAIRTGLATVSPEVQPFVESVVGGTFPKQEGAKSEPNFGTLALDVVGYSFPEGPTASLPERRREVLRRCDDAMETVRDCAATLASQITVPKSRALNRAVNELEKALESKNAFADERSLAQLHLLGERLSEIRQNVSKRKAGICSPCFDRMSVALEDIREAQCELKAITDLPKVMADGLMRTRVHHARHAVYERVAANKGWGDPPIADVAIIGGGPGGIAAAYHAATLGMSTVLLEGSYLAAGFSDARAKAVHVMRTNPTTSSLFIDGVASPANVAQVSMAAFIESTAAHKRASRALSTLEDYSQREVVGNLPRKETIEKDSRPILRGELFEYLLWLSARVEATGNALILEQTPISRAGKNKDGLYELVAPNGDIYRARNVVYAGGFVGSEAQYAKNLAPVEAYCKSHTRGLKVLTNDHDLVAHSSDIAESIERLRHMRESGRDFDFKKFVFADALLGSPEIQSYVSLLPPLSSVAVIGSGESAAKGALELLTHNPGITVHLFSKYPLYPAQTQLPIINARPEVIRRRLINRKEASASLVEMENFGTPITPQTMIDLLQQVEAGKIRIYELGANVDETTINFNSLGAGVTGMQLRPDSSVGQNLERQRQEYLASGMMVPESFARPIDGSLAEIDGGFMIAAGYDRKKLKTEDPLLRSFIEAGLIEVDAGPGKFGGELCLGRDGLTSARDNHIAFVGACNLGTAGDSALFGIGARAQYAIDRIYRNIHPPSMLERGLDAIKSGVLAVKGLLSPTSSPSSGNDTTERFPGNPVLNSLFVRESRGDYLSGPERLTLSRAKQFEERLGVNR